MGVVYINEATDGAVRAADTANSNGRETLVYEFIESSPELGKTTLQEAIDAVEELGWRLDQLVHRVSKTLESGARSVLLCVFRKDKV